MAFRALIFCLMFCLSPAAAGTIAASERPTVAPVLRKVTPGVNIATRRVETVTTKPIHPQTILAHSLNDEALSVGHGAPLVLRVERQLGYKQAKYVMRIDRLDQLGSGKGGFWPDRGYEW